MNCEVCGEKCMGIENLRDHEVTENHQENIKKYQNMLLCHSDESILVPSNAVASEKVPVASENVPVASEAAPVASEKVPAVTEKVPVAPEAVHVVAEAIPVSTENVSIAAQAVLVATEIVLGSAHPVPGFPNSKIENANVFSCMPCSIALFDLSDAIQHSKSVAHAKMVLATGIGFDEEADAYGDYTDPSPTLYYCKLCHFRCFDFTYYDDHLSTKFHKRMVQCVSLLSKATGEICLEELFSKQNADLHANYYCKLCNIQFHNNKCYKQHLKGKKHIKILQFMWRISEGKKENGVCFNDTENLSSSQCYCELCNISVPSYYYEEHLKWKTHKRIEQFMNTMSYGKDKNIIGIFDDSGDSEKFVKFRTPLYYCELCTAWCFGPKSYEIHLNGKKHSRKTKQKQIDADAPVHLNGKKHIRKIKQKRIDADAKVSENINDSSPSSYHCESCSIRYNTSKRYKSHLKSKIHIRVEQLMIKMSERKEEDIGALFGAHDDTDELQFPNHCKLCDVRSSCSKTYGQHMNGKTHKTIKRIISKISNKTD